MLPETVSALNDTMSPVATMSPDTECAVMRPMWLPADISPETLESSTSPSWLSSTTSPETVLNFASVVNPETRASPETTPSFSATWRGARIETSAFALPTKPLNASMKLSQRSCGWSISRMSPSIETMRSLPVTPEISTRAPGSSWAMTSTFPPMRLTLSLRTSSRSMTRDSPGAMTHFSMAMVVLLLAGAAAASARLCNSIAIYRVLMQTRYIASCRNASPASDAAA